MSDNRERRRSGLTTTQKTGSRVSDRWWPMQQMQGKDRFGRPVTREIFVDIHSGKDGGEKTTYEPEGGWNSSPPSLPSGDAGREGSDGRRDTLYRERWGLIDWAK